MTYTHFTKMLFRTSSYSKNHSWISRTSNNFPESQSDLLSNSASVYELQVHRVKIDRLDDYLNKSKLFLKAIKKFDTNALLLGSWTCEIGDQSVVRHLWHYPNGYPSLNAHYNSLMRNQEILQCRNEMDSALRWRRNQICLPFSFWPVPSPRPKEVNGENIYELRSYALKPGTMIEWGNNWARAIKLRSKNNEAVAGLFTHIGDLHVVHHVWCYSDMEARKKSRDDVWQEADWSNCVMRTVPLIRHMSSSILRPTEFSLLQ